jgi:hypothetical protein
LHADEEDGSAFLAGGRTIPSPFGSFCVSNIDSQTGIGGWSPGLPGVIFG